MEFIQIDWIVHATEWYLNIDVSSSRKIISLQKYHHFEMEGNTAIIHIYFLYLFGLPLYCEHIPFTKFHIPFTVITAGITVWIMAFKWLSIRHWLFFLPVLFVSLWWNCWCRLTCTCSPSIGDNLCGICCERKKIVMTCHWRASNSLFRYPCYLDKQPPMVAFLLLSLLSHYILYIVVVIFFYSLFDAKILRIHWFC